MIESLEGLRERLRVFAKERYWDQFHAPKNLSMALIAGAAELIEYFQCGSASAFDPASVSSLTHPPFVTN